MRERINLIYMVTINIVTSKKRESFCKKHPCISRACMFLVFQYFNNIFSFIGFEVSRGQLEVFISFSS